MPTPIDPIRFAVIGEGRDEHGDCSRGPDLHPLTAPHNHGVIVTLVSRILSELHNRRPQPVRWTGVDRSQSGRPKPPPSPGEILADENLLTRQVDKLINPVPRSGNEQFSANFVVLSCDQEISNPVRRAVSRLSSVLREKVLLVVFEPELEILFVQSKLPLEGALGLRHCSTHPPGRGGDLKQSLRQWLRQWSPERRVDLALLERTAQLLDVTPGSYLDDVPAWRSVCKEVTQFL